MARLYDLVMAPGERLGMADQRARLVSGLGGRIIEIGVGTGLNLPHYGGSAHVDGIDPDPHMLARARKKAAEAVCAVQLYETDARRLPFADAAFDAAVIGFALCTIPGPAAALAELRRVVRNGAEIRFLEHVRARNHRVARLQDVIAPLWGRVSGGCRPNQDTAQIISAEGFEITGLWTSTRGGVVNGTARA